MWHDNETDAPRFYNGGTTKQKNFNIFLSKFDRRSDGRKEKKYSGARTGRATIADLEMYPARVPGIVCNPLHSSSHNFKMRGSEAHTNKKYQVCSPDIFLKF